MLKAMIISALFHAVILAFFADMFVHNVSRQVNRHEALKAERHVMSVSVVPESH